MKTWYTLNLHNLICHLYINKTGGKANKAAQGKKKKSWNHDNGNLWRKRRGLEKSFYHPDVPFLDVYGIWMGALNDNLSAQLLCSFLY